MILIAHRGNIDGSNTARENDPGYIEEALRQGCDVEIDVWFQNDRIMLGHDKPQYRTTEKFLENDRFWCHAKNLAALRLMLANKKIHCFWHQEDDFTLTSRNVIWTYPGKALSPGSICVMPETQGIRSRTDLPECLGVCSDYISNFR